MVASWKSTKNSTAQVTQAESQYTQTVGADKDFILIPRALTFPPDSF
jgi:hypothetical protein